MIFRLGVTRTQVADHGATYKVLRGADILEIEVPDDGSEFISTIWMSNDLGDMLLSLPLVLAPSAAGLIM